MLCVFASKKPSKWEFLVPSRIDCLLIVIVLTVARMHFYLIFCSVLQIATIKRTHVDRQGMLKVIQLALMITKYQFNHPAWLGIDD